MAFSYKEYTTRSSGQREFAFAFDAVAKDTTNIKVTIGGVHLYDGVTEYNTTTRLPGSGSTPEAEYTVSSGSITIKTNANGGAVTFTVGSTTVTDGVPTLSSSVPLRIFRQTNRDTAEVTFSSGSILADSDLNKANNQGRFLALEAIDRANESIVIDPNDSTQYNIQVDSADKRIFGVATPTNANDAVPKSYADSTVSSAETYRNSAQDYRDTAESYATRIDGPAQTFSGAADNTSGTGTNTSDYSAKNWAVGVHASNAPSDGSAKEWAIGGEGTVGNAVSGGEYSAKKHAQDASTSASSASDSATAAAASAAATARVFDSFDDKYLGQMADTTSATTASTTGTWAINSSVITVASATDIIVGQEVTGSGIPSDANVIATSGTSITISENMAAAGTGVSLTFTGQGVYGNFDSSKDGPSTDNDGDALVSGSLYFNTTDGEMRVYDGSNWIAASAAQNATILEYVYDITGSVTSIVGASGTGFAENNGAAVSFGSTESVHVYLNGVQLIEGASDDYQLTPSTNTVTLNSAAVSGDIVKIVVYKTFTVGDAVPASTGGTFSGNVSFGDNNKAQFGAGNDLQIYHDGNDSVIKDAGTGNLRVEGEDIYLMSTSNEVKLRADSNSFVKLYYDNSEKLATTSTGVEVTGNVKLSANGGINFNAYATSGNPSSNLLDDYEEGSISGSDFKVGGSSITNLNTGNSKYIKVGNLVNVSVYFNDGNVTLPGTGEFTMDLPFTASDMRMSVAPVIMYIPVGTWDSDVTYPTGMVVSLVNSSQLAFFPTENLNNRLSVTATGTGQMIVSFSITYPSI